MAKRRPALWFYVWDWLNDRDLRACSLEARAVMIDFVCIAHDSLKYGYLCLGGGEISDPFSDKNFLKSASFLFGLTPTKLKKYLKELTEKSVLRQDDNGFIFCSRMLRDEEERIKNKRVKEKRAAGGNRGGNPRLFTPKDNLEVNLSDGGKPVPSSPSPSSSPSKKTPPTTPPSESEGKSGDVGGELSDEQKKYIVLATKFRAREGTKRGYARTLTRKAKAGELDIFDLDELLKLEKEEKEKLAAAERCRLTAERLGISQ